MDARIQLLLTDPVAASRCKWVHDSSVFDAYLLHCKGIVNSNPKAGVGPVTTAIRYAPTPCHAVQGYGLFAQIHGATGQLDQADDDLSRGFFYAGECPACIADLHRRCAVLRRRRLEFDAAIKDADEAVRRYIELGHPGHDIDGNGLASSYNVRGGIRFYMKDFDLAGTNYREALAILHPRVSPVLYRFVIYNLANALRMTGRYADLLEADKYLTKANVLFKGVREDSQEWAKLGWVTSQVRYQLHKGQAYKLKEKMEGALDFFLAEGMDLDAIAVAADLMKMKLARRWGRGEHRDFIREILDTLHEGLPRIPVEVRKGTARVSNALGRVTRSVDVAGWDGKAKLHDAVDDLRKACGPEMIACLITW